MLKLCAALLAACAVVLAGCSSDGSGDYALYWKAVHQAFSQSLSNGAVTREQAGAIPYASLGYRLDGSREAILVLATDTDGDLLWTANSHVVLVTRDGRVKRSVGLGHDLGGQTAQSADGVPAPAAALKGAVHYQRKEDFPDLGLYGVALDCTLTAAGPQTIAILQQPLATIRIAERCNASAAKWSFSDSFWIDPQSGFTWRSQQHMHPQGAVLDIEILRPPG